MNAMLLLVSILYSLLFESGNAAKILLVFPTGFHSHYTLGFKLAKELAERGHEVTFINAYPQNHTINNLKEISVSEDSNLKAIKNDLYDLRKLTYLNQLKFAANYGYLFTETVLMHRNIQNLLNSGKTFDLVIMEHLFNEAMFIFAHRFHCPLIILGCVPPTVYNNYLLANPSQPSYIPNFLLGYSSHMSLWERLKNTYYDIAGEIFMHLVVLKKQNEILKRAVPDAPNLQEPAPLLPNIKEIGGYHVGPLKPLPRDIREFLDTAKEGVIVFSMGSNLNSSNFPHKTKQAVLKAFSKVKQKVLWKFETNLPERPKNVKILSWLPQQDVLAHHNVILFITHGGLLGTTEAVYYGVPMLGLPVFWDQNLNTGNVVKKGMGLRIPFHQINYDNFDWTLNELINNPIYRENAKKGSKIMRDQPIKQIDEAIYWIEYVIRHKGAPHLRSAALDLKWYQRYLIDISIVLVVIIVLLFTILSFSFRYFFSKETTKINISKKNI